MTRYRNYIGPLRYLRLHPFDLGSEEGRTAERYRLALWAVIANVVSKSISMLVMVFSVSLTLPYLGAERFGVWMTIASFVGMLVFLDLGVGNALTNRVAHVAAKDDKSELPRAISGGLGLLFIVGVTSSMILCVLVVYIPWQVLIKVTDSVAQGEIRQAMFLFSGLFGATLISTGVHKVYAGLQRSFEAHAASALGSVASLAMLWWAAKAQAGIPMLLSVTLGGQLVSGLSLLVVLKRRRLFHFHGIATDVGAEKHAILKLGGLFIVLQIGTMVGWGADSLIISSTLGAGQVAVFSVAQRLFQTITIPVAMLNAPLWSSYADANTRGDTVFILKTLRSSTLTTACLTFGGGLMLVFVSEDIIRWLTNGAIVVPSSLIWIFFAWTLCETLGNSLAMMMNGCNIVREQVFTVLVLSAIAMPAKIFFVNFYGVSGMLAVYIFLYCLVVGVCYGYIFRNIIRKKIGLI